MTENRIFTLCHMITYLSSVSQNVLKFHQQLTGEERRISFIFDRFHFCHSRVITLNMTESRDVQCMSYNNLSKCFSNFF